MSDHVSEAAEHGKAVGLRLRQQNRGFLASEALKRHAMFAIAYMGGIEAGRLGYDPERDEQEANAFMQAFLDAVYEHDDDPSIEVVFAENPRMARILDLVGRDRYSAECRYCGKPISRFTGEGRNPWFHESADGGVNRGCRAATFTPGHGWDESVPRKQYAAPPLGWKP